mmetsp:Transcript_16768/g.34074  ORF Transcript_16768/g.34074 Transcript_16768/m.34074 type:complete len:190 (-) Transcript_16768:330-899(-)
MRPLWPIFCTRIDFKWWSNGSWKPCGWRGQEMGRAAVETLTAKPAIRPNTQPKSSCSNTAPSNPKSKKSLSNIHRNGDVMVQDGQDGITGNGRTEATTTEPLFNDNKVCTAIKDEAPSLTPLGQESMMFEQHCQNLEELYKWIRNGNLLEWYDFVQGGNNIRTGAGVGVSAWGRPRGGGKSHGCFGKRG